MDELLLGNTEENLGSPSEDRLAREDSLGFSETTGLEFLASWDMRSEILDWQEVG